MAAGIHCVSALTIFGERASAYGYSKDCASALCGPGARMLFAEPVQAGFEGQVSDDRFRILRRSRCAGFFALSTEHTLMTRG